MPDPKLHPVDERIIESAVTGEGTIPIESQEQLLELVDAARRTSEEFLENVRVTLTVERAAFVRKLRVDEGYTWRAVAQECYDEWKGDWSPPWNQLMGMALCELAAEHFGENYMTEPWN